MDRMPNKCRHSIYVVDSLNSFLDYIPESQRKLKLEIEHKVINIIADYHGKLLESEETNDK